MSESHEVIFFTDGRHTSTYQYEPPMGIRQYLEPIDELVDIGIDTIIYGVGDGGVLHYGTEAGERWGHNVDLIDTAIWYRGGLNLTATLERGIDPLHLICEHAQTRGFQFIPSFLVPLHHTPRNRVTNGRTADFAMDHPEWQVGPELDHPLGASDRPDRFSFLIPEIRANRFEIIRELVDRYPTDGVELNFGAPNMPLIARRDVSKHTQTLTDWISDIRAACNEAAAIQKRQKRLVVRVACTLKGNKAMGLDIQEWLRAGLVDTVIAMPAVGGFESETSLLKEIADAAQETNCTVVAGIDDRGMGQVREVNIASAANAYAAGANGVFYHTYYPDTGRYPYDDAALGRLRFQGYPDLLSHKDKIFRVAPTTDPNPALHYGEEGQLPAYLVPGEPGPEITVDVWDDLANKAERRELWKCELRVMIQNMVHHDRVRLVWNDVEIPPEAQRLADWTYQLRPKPDHAVLGYRLHVNLTGDWLPKQGRNKVRVDVLEKDEKLIHPISVAEIEIAVEYLPHRHGLRPSERFAGYERL